MAMPNLIRFSQLVRLVQEPGLPGAVRGDLADRGLHRQELELRFLDYQFGEPRYAVLECRRRDLTYAAPLRVRAQLLIKETGEIKESEIFMGDFPLMTETGTFVINGAERVVVSQLGPLAGRLFHRRRGAGDGQAVVRRQADPQPRCLARI